MDNNRRQGRRQPDARNSAARGAANPDAAPNYEELFRQLVARANQGDSEALKRLRRFLDVNPQLWDKFGDLTALAERAWIELLAGSNQLVAESVKRTVAKLKSDLAGQHPTRLEELLIQHLAACHLAVQHAELQAASPATGSLEQAGFRLKRAESAQKRLLSATKTLALLRSAMPAGLVPANPMHLFDPGEKRA